MKTTIEFSDALLHATRRAAAERRATSRSIFELALRQYLEGQDETSPGLRRHTFRGRGLQAGLSEGDWAAIRERAYEFTTPGSQRSAATTESASCARGSRLQPLSRAAFQDPLIPQEGSREGGP